MIKNFVLITLAVPVIALSACKNKVKSGFNVSGTFRNVDKLAMAEGPVTKLLLLEVPSGADQQPVILDSVRITGNSGSFNLSAPVKKEEVYELVFGNNAIAVPLINDASEVKVDVDLAKKDDFYTVSGSTASAQLRDLINVFGRKNYMVELSMANLDSLKNNKAPDSVLLLATTQKNNAIQDLNTYLKQFINTNGNATVSALALSWASRSFSKADFESSLNDLIRKNPGNEVLNGIKASYDAQATQMANMQKSEGEKSWIGKQAPDLELNDLNGNKVSIASFRGKYLLVDFWASWCGPCRQENPNVVQAYQTFKGKNFAILGVSLDKDKDAWKQAVAEDKLAWTQVSDLKFWNSKAVETFGFEAIPFNVLIDPQGKVIGEGLRGDQLQGKLKEVLQ